MSVATEKVAAFITIAIFRFPLTPAISTSLVTTHNVLGLSKLSLISLILFHEKSDTDVNAESFAASKFFHWNCELQIVNWYRTHLTS